MRCPVPTPMYGLSLSQSDQRIRSVFQSVYNKILVMGPEKHFDPEKTYIHSSNKQKSDSSKVTSLSSAKTWQNVSTRAFSKLAYKNVPVIFRSHSPKSMRSTCLKLANQKARGFQLSRDRFWQEMRVSSCEDGVYSFSSTFTKVVFYT